MSAINKIRHKARAVGRKLRARGEMFASQRMGFPKWTPLRADERIRVLFIVITPQVWPSLEPVWRKLSADDRFNTKVVVIEKSIEAVSLAELRAAHDLMIETGVPFAKGSSFSIHQYRPHVVFYPLPYNDFYPYPFKFKEAHRAGARIAYVNYGFETGGGAHNAYFQYDQRMLQEAWRIFARSRYQVANFARYCDAGNAHVVLTGHPRGAQSPEDSGTLSEDILALAKDRKIVLWAPHFSVTTRRKWSSFLENHAGILEEIDKRLDLFFILRPHPFLEANLRSAEGWSATRASELFDEIGARENVHIDRSTAYWPTFNSSDALMTDPGSFLAEYLLVDKPICLLSSSDGIGLGRETASFTSFERGDTVADISNFLDLIAAGTDTKSADREAARAAYFGDKKSDPAEIIMEEIIRGITDRPFRVAKALVSEKHRAAFNYWKRAQNTFLAPAGYYEKQEALLSELLDRIKPKGFAVDVGCGNGRFTELFAKHCTFVEGIDPSKALVEQAQSSAQEKGIQNIEYRQGSLERPNLMSAYDLVACMGVLSGFFDNEKFLQASHWLRAATKPGGRLILKESLSTGALQTTEHKGYVAVYRNINDYLEAFRSAGFELAEEITIAAANEQGLTNRLFVFDAVNRRIKA